MRKLWQNVALTVIAAACSKSEPPTPVPAPASLPRDEAQASHRRKHEDRHESAAAPVLQLTVALAGNIATWDTAAFQRVARFAGNNRARDGEAREVWSLRDLARTLIGPTARVVSVTGDDGAHPIDDAAWRDPAREPLLHTTRRGTLKFRWADAHGAWGEAEAKDVTRIEVTR
jgi:hypothetical protein